MTFSVSATGSGLLEYQWLYQGFELQDNAQISGANAAVLTLRNVALEDSGNLEVVVIDDDGFAVSARVKLTVTPPNAQPPRITLQPANQSVAEGGEVVFTVQASGEGTLSYQWLLNGAPLIDGGAVSGAKTAQLNLRRVGPNLAGNYAAVVAASGLTATSATATLTVTPAAAKLVADNGFRPHLNGFNFENYGNVTGLVNLTPEEMRRMFGDEVCATLTASRCVLTPPAKKWMDQINQDMNGGHCEGMAVLSLLIYSKVIDVRPLGASTIIDLNLAGNAALQREIAFWWATQAVDPTQSAELFGEPAQVLDHLIQVLKPGATETYTIGVRMEGKGGHAVTPYAVEDKGSGIFHVLTYDNNHPKVASRLVVDRNKNTWSFNLSTSPDVPESVWSGDAATRSFSVVPSSPRLTRQVAPFAHDVASPGRMAGLGPEKPLYNQLWIDGDGVKLLITDGAGKRYGYSDGKFFREIAGVRHHTIRSGDELWADSPSPVYFVPTGIAFTLTLDGSVIQKATETAVTLIGPGYVLAIEDIQLDPNQKDTIVFSPDGTAISYQSSGNESPDIVLGFEAPGADYEFLVKGVDIEKGAVINLKLDEAKQNLTIDTKGNQKAGVYEFFMGRFEQDNEEYFDNDEIELNPEDRVILNYGQWKGNASAVPLLIDRDGDGTIDETIELIDEDKHDGSDPGAGGLNLVRFDSVTMQGAEVLIRLSGPSGARVCLQTSADLAAWSRCDLIILADGKGEVRFQPAERQKFYRASLQTE